MLSFKFVTDATRAGHYFESSDDYYGKEGHLGEWIGTAVPDLGLQHANAVERAMFQQLLEGQMPDGRRMRTAKTKGSEDRKGIDFTFSAPKSVSIQALVQDDQRIVAAHDRAVKKSLELMETFAATRKKVRGLSYRERTGNLVAATFRHELSRAQDPQLHTHTIVMNMTKRSDGRWRALSNEDMLRNVKLVGAFYRATLAEELRTLGYGLRETRKGGWELADIPDSVIRHFSKRSQEIERLLAERGQARETASSEHKQMVTLASRRKKTESDRTWLREQWRETAREAGLDLDRHPTLSRGCAGPDLVEAAKVRFHGDPVAASQAANSAVDFAIAHLAERQGIFSRAELLEVAYGRAATLATTAQVRLALDSATMDGRLIPELPLYQTARSFNTSASEIAKDPKASQFKGHDEREKMTRNSWIGLTLARRGLTEAQATRDVDAAIDRGALVPAEPRFATPAARRSELHILAMEQAGRGAVSSVATQQKVDAMLQGTELNAGQRDAVRMVLRAQDRFVGIQGLAGTGKSHMMAKAVEGIKAEAARMSIQGGYRVIGLAPYASQKEALAQLGMESQTLARFLVSSAQHRSLNDKSIVFLDEAGVVPAHQLESLMAIIDKQKARLVLSGDRQQTHAVEAGKPFEQLQDAGMTKAFLTEVQRQKDLAIRAAVVQAANNQVGDAVETLRHTVVEVRNDLIRYERLARSYAGLPAEERRETLIVAGTNDARRAINALVRERLDLPAGDQVEALQSVDMTRAELRAAQSYEAGQIIVPQRQDPVGLMKDEQLTVVSHDVRHNLVTVRRENGTVLTFDPEKHAALRLYERETLRLASGDWVRITANHPQFGLYNGDRCEVAGVDAVCLQLKRGDHTVSMDRSRPIHAQHGYASTIHAAQGLTKNRVLVEANTKSLTSNRAVFYVAISRPRHAITIFTDDASRLAAAMSREPKKYAALELRDLQVEAALLKGRIEQPQGIGSAVRAAAQRPLRPSRIPKPATSAGRSAGASL